MIVMVRNRLGMRGLWEEYGSGMLLDGWALGGVFLTRLVSSRSISVGIGGMLSVF
jgi:hypothetical protein